MKTYLINEMFCSPQGEGARQGELSLFVRFAGCNLRCKIEPGTRSPGGFDCDTEFTSGRRMSAEWIVSLARELWTTKTNAFFQHGEKMPTAAWVIFTGGEPMLQLDAELIRHFRADAGWNLAIETNGTREIPDAFGLDWICVSPKVAEHAIRQLTAHEVKYVRGFGQVLPRTRVEAQRYFISPAFDGTELDRRTLEWCESILTPPWELSVQKHKLWGVR